VVGGVAPLRVRPLRDAVTLRLLGAPAETVRGWLDLNPAEVAALAAVPEPAWTTDPFRLPRLLQAGLEACPGTAAQLLARTPFPALVDALRRDPALLEVVRGERTLPGLAAPLALRILVGAARDVWQVESAGLGDSPQPGPGIVVCAAALVEVGRGTEDFVAEAAQTLRTGGFEALVDLAATPARWPVVEPSERGLVAVGRGAHAGRLERLEAPLSTLLVWLGPGRPLERVLERLAQEDVPADDALSLLEEWRGDGLVALG